MSVEVSPRAPARCAPGVTTVLTGPAGELLPSTCHDCTRPSAAPCQPQLTSPGDGRPAVRIGAPRGGQRPHTACMRPDLRAWPAAHAAVYGWDEVMTMLKSVLVRGRQAGRRRRAAGLAVLGGVTVLAAAYLGDPVHGRRR